MEINTERIFDAIQMALNDLLDYRLHNCDRNEFADYENYAKTVKDLCIACDVLTYYKGDIIDKIEHFKGD